MKMAKQSLLQAASSISPEHGSHHRFTAIISKTWTTQHSVLGGFLNALMLAAGQRFVAAELGPQFPDSIHVFVQFLRIVPPGPVTIVCTCLRVSSRQCVVRVEISRTAGQTTVGIVTYGDLSREKGLTQTTRPIVLPDRRTECATIDDPVVDATPVTSKLHWVAPRSADGLWGHRLGGHQREVWVSFRDGSTVSDVLHLALLSDMPLQPPATHQAGFYTRYALSTLCLSLEFKKRPRGVEWVMVRSNSYAVRDGRYDVSIQILDEGGDLLALSNHVLYIHELRTRVSKL